VSTLRIGKWSDWVGSTIDDFLVTRIVDFCLIQEVSTVDLFSLWVGEVVIYKVCE
jgi:hypothetical protein